jgi:hypothetical protein
MSHKQNPPRQDRRRVGKIVEPRPVSRVPAKPVKQILDRNNGRDEPFSKSRPVTTQA